MEHTEQKPPGLGLNESTSVGRGSRSVKNSLVTLWFEGTRIERAGYVAGSFLLLSGLAHAVILLASGGSWEGPLSLRKPTTFGISFGLTLVAIVWVSPFIPLSRRMKAWLLGGFTLACVTETALVSMQAWRGVPSHFNLETAFDAFVARGLAAGGFVLIVVIAILTWASFRTDPHVPPSLRLAIRVGFVTLFSAQIVGAVMISRGMIAVFSGHQEMAYATAGSLKPIHAVTMHGVLALPALAWLLSFTGWSERRRVQIVGIAAGIYLVMIATVVALVM